MAFVIAGHMRSGTTMLRRVCQTHPRLEVTREFGNFRLLNAPYLVYARAIVGQWWRKRGGIAPLNDEGVPSRRRQRFRNLVYVARYLAQVRRFQRGRVTGTVIDQALRCLAPHAREIGDKHPDYALQLEELTRDEAIRCVFIFRDPRDVASSTLEKTRGAWRLGHSDELRDPRGIAQRWVRMMDAAERCHDHLLLIRYEDFVRDPEPTLQQLATWLDVEPGGFDSTPVHPASIGRHQQGLTEQERADIVDVAGPAMRRFGYLT